MPDFYRVAGIHNLVQSFPVCKNVTTTGNLPEGRAFNLRGDI